MSRPVRVTLRHACTPTQHQQHASYYVHRLMPDPQHAHHHAIHTSNTNHLCNTLAARSPPTICAMHETCMRAPNTPLCPFLASLDQRMWPCALEYAADAVERSQRATTQRCLRTASDNIRPMPHSKYFILSPRFAAFHRGLC